MKHHVPHFLFCFLLVCSVLACTAAAFTPEMPELSAEIPEAVAKTALSEAAYGAKPAETTSSVAIAITPAAWPGCALT